MDTKCCQGTKTTLVAIENNIHCDNHDLNESSQIYGMHEHYMTPYYDYDLFYSCSNGSVIILKNINFVNTVTNNI